MVAGGQAVLVHNSGPGKPDDELLSDARSLHETMRSSYGDRAYNGTTVATGEFGGEYVYTVNRNKTNTAMRALADSLGYTRVSGSKYIGPNQTDAEQVMLNAVDQGRLSDQGRMATSRPPCGPSRQNCSGRIGEYPGIDLVGGS